MFAEVTVPLPSVEAFSASVGPNETGIFLKFLEEPKLYESTTSLGSSTTYFVYEVEVSFNSLVWRVDLRYSEARYVFELLRRERLPFPPKRTWSWHETGADVIADRRRRMQLFFQRAVSLSRVWTRYRELRELFEVSAVSFLHGDKALKEGHVRLLNASALTTSSSSSSGEKDDDEDEFAKVPFFSSYALHFGGGPARLLSLGGSSSRRRRRRPLWAVLRRSHLALYESSTTPTPVAVFAFDDTTPYFLPVGARDVAVKLHGAIQLVFRPDAERNQQTWIALSKRRPRGLSSSSSSEQQRDGTRSSFFAPERTLRSTDVRFLVCGKDYFEAVADALDAATSEVFITDWRCNPNVMLRRPGRGTRGGGGQEEDEQPQAQSREPPAAQEEEESTSSNVTLLELISSLARRRVKVYVLLYREVNENIQKKHQSDKVASQLRSAGARVMRHPNHFAAGQLFWSHHEKVVVVDQCVAFVGGMDLVEGRYDDAEHRLTGDAALFPDDDYYQPNAPHSKKVDRAEIPRMPWHDVAVRLQGLAARDVALHFVQRWNHHRLVRRVVPEDGRTRPKFLPRRLTANAEDDAKDTFYSPLLPPDHDQDHHQHQQQQGRRPRQSGDDDVVVDPSSSAFSPASSPQKSGGAVRVVRSVGKWSLGSSETSVAKAWIDAIRNATRCIYVEQQFFITSFGEDDDAVSSVKQADSFFDALFFSHSSDQSSTQRRRQRQKQQKTSTSTKEEDSESSSDEDDAVFDDFTKGVKNEIGKALLERVRRAVALKETFKVLIVLPLHPNGKFLPRPSEEVKAVMQQQSKSIRTFLAKVAADVAKVDDYVAFCALRTADLLLGSRRPTSEMIYVHAKLLIVDDRLAVVGSANLNDRSMVGDRDSEVAVVVRDDDSGAVADFRRTLLFQHLHFDVPDIVRDWKKILDTADRNAKALYDTFDSGLDWNHIRSWDVARKFICLSRTLAPDETTTERPGFSPSSPWPSSQWQEKNPRHDLQGSLCAFPVDFLAETDALAPSALAKFVVGRRLFQ